MVSEKEKKDAVTKSWARINPMANAALTINQIHQNHLDFTAIADEMSDSFSKIKKGNLTEGEAMLWTQAQTLNVFFHRCLSQVSELNMVNQIQTFSDLAMKAQNNCRKTLLALAEIKNPKRATFIKQQNNAINQQVNNNSENLKNNSNEVLCEAQNAKLDDRSKEETITINSSLETLAAIDRSQNG